MKPMEPLAPSVVALLDREKNAYGDLDADRARAYAHATRRIALVAAPPAAGLGAAAVALKAKALTWKAASALVVASLAVGVVAGRATAPRPPPPAVVPVIPAVAPVAPTLPSPSHEPVPAMPSVEVVTPKPLSTKASTSRVTLARERELVEAARVALSRGRPVDALDATNLHAREFPEGQLIEEREVLAITALRSLGRSSEADARAVRFRKRFPQSVLLLPEDR